MGDLAEASKRGRFCLQVRKGFSGRGTISQEVRFTESFEVQYGDSCEEIETMREDSIDLIVNDRRVATLMATPVELEELGLGYMVGEGLVDSPEQVNEVETGSDYIRAEVEGQERIEVWHELRSSGCVGIGWEGSDARVESEAEFPEESIYAATEFLKSEVYDRTHGAHGATLVDVDGEKVLKALDVSRHNAYDKVLGKGLKEGIDFSELFLLSTGRQSAGMVMKAARCGVPLIVTKTAAISSGVEAAKKSRVGLACFASEEGFKVLAHQWRIGK